MRKGREPERRPRRSACGRCSLFSYRQVGLDYLVDSLPPVEDRHVTPTPVRRAETRMPHGCGAVTQKLDSASPGGGLRNNTAKPSDGGYGDCMIPAGAGRTGEPHGSSLGIGDPRPAYMRIIHSAVRPERIGTPCALRVSIAPWATLQRPPRFLGSESHTRSSPSPSGFCGIGGLALPPHTDTKGRSQCPVSRMFFCAHATSNCR